MKFTDAFPVQPKPLFFIEALVLVILIGILDYVTSWGLSLFVFYGVPIFSVAWLGYRNFAVVIAVLCGLTWHFANAPTQPYASTEAYVWASVNRTFYFIFVAFGGAAMRAQRDESRARIEALTRASELEQEIVRVAEHEQMRIGQDLHDGLCQNLAAIDCAAACLKADLEEMASPGAKMAGMIQKMLKDAVLEARNLARGIFPVQMDAEGLSAALGELVALTNQLRQASATFETSGDIQIGAPQVAMHLYRIAQEALSNALRHAKARHIAVRLVQEGVRLTMTIADDGCGFAPDAPSSAGMGLRTIRYRTQLIDGSLAIESKPGEGTTVRCSLQR